MFNTVQDAFLGGYLAAGMTKTGKVATYGGMKFGTVTIYMDGFWDGVQYYNKQHHTNVQVLGWSEPSQNGTFAGSFTNLTAGQTIANTFIHDGADIIFPVAGGVGLGSAKAVQTANSSGKNIAMYWVDTDGCVSAATYCPYFITSVEKGISTAVKAAVLAAATACTGGGSYVGTLANGGAVLAPFHDYTTKIPATLQSRAQGGGAGDHHRQDRSRHQEPRLARAARQEVRSIWSVSPAAAGDADQSRLEGGCAGEA